MKKVIFMALIAIGLNAATTLSAQQRMTKERPTDEQIAQQVTNRLAQELNLDQTQAKQVYDVQLKQIGQMKAHREAMRQERQGEANRMKQILTPEQYEKWSQMQSRHHRAKMGNQGKDCNNCGKCDNCKKRNCDKQGK